MSDCKHFYNLGFGDDNMSCNSCKFGVGGEKLTVGRMILLLEKCALGDEIVIRNRRGEEIHGEIYIRKKQG